MTDANGASVHASAVLVGETAVLIRGPSGSGKSRLAFDLILAGRAGQIPTARLVGDDRVFLQAAQNQLLVRPSPELAGLIEIRGLGIRRCDFAPEAVVGLIVDLYADDAARMPAPSGCSTRLLGIKLPRIPIELDYPPVSVVLAALTTRPMDNPPDF